MALSVFSPLALVSVAVAQDTSQEPIVPLAGQASTNTVVEHTVIEDVNSPYDSQYDISGGVLSNGPDPNLFHRFSQFDVDTGAIANFVTPDQVANVINLVSSLNPSQINGLLQMTEGDADLFIVNPAGVLFGVDAQLNLTGGLIATSAAALEFGDQFFTVDGLPLDSHIQISTTAASTVAALNGAPTGYVFSELSPAAVTVNGTLSVDSGESIALIGGTVQHNGTLQALGGQVFLIAVPEGHVIRWQNPGDILSFEALYSDLPTHDPVGFVPNLGGIAARVTGGEVAEANAIVQTDDGAFELVTYSAGLNANAPGTALVRGHIESDHISVQAPRIALQGASLSVDSPGGGGTINIGNGPSSPFPTGHIWSDRFATLSARATDKGKGGTIHLWATDSIIFVGQTDVSGAAGEPDGTVILEAESVLGGAAR